MSPSLNLRAPGSRAVAAVAFVAAALAAPAQAANVALSFQGVNLHVAGEFINAVPVPLADQQFAPLLVGGHTISATLNYDTAQPDFDPDPNTGTYRSGTLSVSIPEVGLAVSRTSNSMQISAFDNCGVCDQFTALSVGTDSFVNGVGLPAPSMFWVLFFGDAAMLAGEALPTAPLDWNFGNFSMDFRATDGSIRQVLMLFEPAADVPEPSIVALLCAALAGAALARPRRRRLPQAAR